MLLEEAAIQFRAQFHGFNGVRDITQFCLNERQAPLETPCCESVGSLRAGLSCRTSCCRQFPRLPTLSLCSSRTACSISMSSCWSKRSTIARRLKSSFNSFNLPYSLLAANLYTGDILPFASSSPTLCSNLVMEARVTSHRLRQGLPVISNFVISAIVKTGNRSYLHGTVINTGRKKTHKTVRAQSGSKN